MMLQPSVGTLTQSKIIPSIAPVEEWKQQTGEPLLWHQRFYAFLLLPPRSRSMLGAYKAYVKRTDPERAKVIGFSRCPDGWNEAATKYNWQDRAIAYDIAKHDEYVTGVEDQRQAVVDELKVDAMDVWRKSVQTIKHHKPETMSLQGATYALPRLYAMIKELFGIDKMDATPSLSAIMAVLPPHVRSDVLSIISVSQVNITVNQSEQGSTLPLGDIIDGKVVEVNSG